MTVVILAKNLVYLLTADVICVRETTEDEECSLAMER